GTATRFNMVRRSFGKGQEGCGPRETFQGELNHWTKTRRVTSTWVPRINEGSWRSDAAMRPLIPERRRTEKPQRHRCGGGEETTASQSYRPLAQPTVRTEDGRR